MNQRDNQFEEEFNCSVNNVDVKLTDEYVKCSDMEVFKL